MVTSSFGKGLLLAAVSLALLGVVSGVWFWRASGGEHAEGRAGASLDPRRLEAALDSVESRDLTTRRRALWTLALSRHPDGFEPLEAATLDRNPLYKQIAVLGLGMLGDPRAKRVLVRALTGEEPAVREDAAWALSRLLQGEGVAPLARRWLESEPVGVRFGSELLLGLAHAQGPAAAATIMTGHLSHAGEWKQPAKTDRILAEVLAIANSPRTAEVVTRVDVFEDAFAAIAVAGRTPDCLGLPFLIGKYLGPGKEEYRAPSVAQAAEAQVMQMAQTCVPARLLTLLKSAAPAPERRLAAVWLRAYGGHGVLAELARLPAEQDPEVRRELEETLRLLRSPRTSTALRAELALATLDPFEPETGPRFMKALAAADRAGRLPVFRAMREVYGGVGLLADHRRQELLERLETVGFPKLPPVLAWLGPAEVDTLIGGLLESDPEVVKVTWELVCLFGDRRFLLPVLAIADKLPPSLPLKGELPHWARPEDVRALDDARRSGSTKVRFLVAESLGQVRSNEASVALEALFSDSSAAVRVSAYRGFANVTGRSGIPRLEAQLSLAKDSEVLPLLSALYRAEKDAATKTILELLVSPVAGRAKEASSFVLLNCYGMSSTLFQGLASPLRSVRQRTLAMLEACSTKSSNWEELYGKPDWQAIVRQALSDSDRSWAARLSCVLASKLESHDTYAPALKQLGVNGVWLEMQKSGAPRTRDCASRLLAAVGDESGLLTLVGSVPGDDHVYDGCKEDDRDCQNTNYYLEAERKNTIDEQFRGHITPTIAKALEKLLSRTKDELDRERIRGLLESGMKEEANHADPTQPQATNGNSSTKPPPTPSSQTAVAPAVKAPFLSDALLGSELLFQFLAPPTRSTALSGLLRTYSDGALDGLAQRYLSSIMPGEGAEVLDALAKSQRVVDASLLLPHLGYPGTESSAVTILGRTRAPVALVALLAAELPSSLVDGALEPWGDADGAKVLMAALGHVSVRVRSRAATYLGKLRVKGAAEPLLEALYDTNGEVRAAAASAIGRLGEPRAQAKLAEVVLRSTFGQPGFDEALGAWVHLQGTKAVRVLEECTQPSESNPTMLARSVLEKVKRPK